MKLFNPVLDTTENKYFERLGNRAKDFSPSLKEELIYYIKIRGGILICLK